MLDEKPIVWIGSSLDDLQSLPNEPRRDIGFALSAVQAGKFPQDAKSLKGLSGVYEIRADFDKSTYRAVYVVNLGAVIYVLHVFQKKSKQGIATPKADTDLIRVRLKLAKEEADNG